MMHERCTERGTSVLFLPLPLPLPLSLTHNYALISSLAPVSDSVQHALKQNPTLLLPRIFIGFFFTQVWRVAV